MGAPVARPLPMCALDRPPRHALVAALVLLALAMASLALAEPATACEGADANPRKASLGKIEKATRCLLNDRRRKHGLRSLDGNGKLDESSVRHSRDMEQQNYFSHTSRNGDNLVARVRRTGYLAGSNDWTLGENIAWGTDGRAKPRRIVKSWMNSSGHRRNILRGSFRDIGIGVARGAPTGGQRDAAVYTTDFGDN